jgi:hypothetical protein
MSSQLLLSAAESPALPSDICGVWWGKGWTTYRQNPRPEDGASWGPGCGRWRSLCQCPGAVVASSRGASLIREAGDCSGLRFGIFSDCVSLSSTRKAHS